MDEACWCPAPAARAPRRRRGRRARLAARAADPGRVLARGAGGGHHPGKLPHLAGSVLQSTPEPTRCAIWPASSAPRRCPAAAGASIREVPPELSVSCLSYFALKVAGESAEAPHMRAARAAIARAGRRRGAPTRTRATTWRCSGKSPGTSVPAIPPEMLFFPRQAPVLRLRPVEPGRARSSSRCRSSGPKSRSSRSPSACGVRGAPRATRAAARPRSDASAGRRLEDGLPRHRQAAQGGGAGSRRRALAPARRQARAAPG